MAVMVLFSSSTTLSIIPEAGDATVDEYGRVTTKKAGTVTITIKASNGTAVYEDTIELTVNAPASPQTGITPIWVYGGIIALLLIIGVVIYKKKELF